MNLLHVQDRGDGTVQVSWQGEGGIPRSALHSAPIRNPLGGEARRELRWYLEEYLQSPRFGNRQRAQEVENRLAGWGEALFTQVFPKGDVDPDPRALYQEAVREGLEGCELCVSSDDAAFLNIPWELLRDPCGGAELDP